MAEQICDRLQKHLVAGESTDINEGKFFAYNLKTRQRATTIGEKTDSGAQGVS